MNERETLKNLTKERQNYWTNKQTDSWKNEQTKYWTNLWTSKHKRTKERTNKRLKKKERKCMIITRSIQSNVAGWRVCYHWTVQRPNHTCSLKKYLLTLNIFELLCKISLQCPTVQQNFVSVRIKETKLIPIQNPDFENF